MNSEKSATRSRLVRRYLTVLDLKTSCRALSASVRWSKKICRSSRAPQPISKCHESHVSGIGAILILDDSAPSLNAVSRNKKSASVRQVDGPTNFNPIWPRQKICSSTTENWRVCGSLKYLIKSVIWWTQKTKIMAHLQAFPSPHLRSRFAPLVFPSPSHFNAYLADYI